MDLPTTTQTSTSLSDVFVIEDFFTQQHVDQLFSACQQLPAGDPFVDQHGVFKGQLVSEQKFLNEDELSQDVFASTVDKVKSVFPVNTYIIEAVYSKLYLPWDIHSDYLNSDRQKIQQPFYNVLIPLHDVDSRTFIFDQTADNYNDFYMYKEHNQPVDNPVSEETWNEYLDYCWPEDRQYLSVNTQLPAQRAGQLVAFRRHFFHSSDNFHKRNTGPKHFVQFLLDID